MGLLTRPSLHASANIDVHAANLLGTGQETHPTEDGNTHALPLRQDRLPVGLEPLDPSFAKIDRRHLGNVGRRPHGINAGRGLGFRRLDRDDTAMRMSGAHDAHMKLVRKGDIGDEPPASGDERRVFEPRDRLADDASVLGHGRCAILRAAAHTALTIAS